jgi:transposase
MGVLAFRVVEGYIDVDVFQSFVENEVAFAVQPGMICLRDNAAIHHTPVVRGTVHTVFDGMYLYAAPYSPDLKPVERLFAEVKDILRDIEDEAALDPIGTISSVFELFRPGQPEALMARNHFRMYRDNQNQYRLRIGIE